MDARTMIVECEGRANDAYPDPVTHGAPWTIGIGHTGPEVHPGLHWSDDQIDEAFECDLKGAIGQCVLHFGEMFEGLNEPRQAVLISMVFQMGIHGVLQFSQTLAAIRDERWHDAFGQMMDSKWAHQTPKRAMRLARMMETGEW